MARNTAPLKSQHSAERESEDSLLRWSAPMRLGITALLAFHLAAVFLGAWNGAPPRSYLSETLAIPFRPYIVAADLDHGYRFFAPDPGPSHLVDYFVFAADGSTISEGRFPDLKEHWPRLLYHRYFMLSEHVLQYYPPPGAPREYRAERMPAFRAVMNAYAQQLLKEHGGSRAELRLIQHGIADPDRVAAGELTLDAPQSYRELWRGTFEREGT